MPPFATPKTASRSGFAIPAEWNAHDATWLAFPHRRSDWPGKISSIRWVYGEIIKRVAVAERVALLVNDDKTEAHAKSVIASVGVNESAIDWMRWPTDRSWIRDFGPIFVQKDGTAPDLAVAHFGFNGWAKYPEFHKDYTIPRLAAQALELRSFRSQDLFPSSAGDVVLEGGSIDVNGKGSILATEECLLDPNVQVRNPGFSKSDWELTFRECLGAPNTIWLGNGIAGDDTHGHVDDLARFVSPTTIVLCQEADGSDANHRPLEENRERLEQARLQDGSRPQVVRLPMPAPLFFRGQRLPASYANFYICNAAVLVPTFNDPADRAALGIIAELISDRPVVGIHATDLVLGLGTLHCLSQQQPSL
ncbi:MAG: agmatine deiminase family protein [Deltaproteobacteria bacterium]|nr:agmatine deiminase family protein [Deltaproteobacteria bacterium]